MELPSQLVQIVITKIIKDNGFVTYDLNWSEGSKQGDGFVGLLYKIKVTGTKENQENGKISSLSLFCKIPHDTEIMRNDFDLNESFQREHMMYSEVFEDFERFQAEKGIKDGFVLYPKCYASNKTDFEEYVIMEDLSSQGFVLFDRQKPLDFEHSQLVMQELGRFHSLSFAIKNQRPDVLAKYKGRFTELLIKDPLKGAKKSFIENFVKSAVDTVELEGLYREKWERFHKNYLDIMRHALDGASAEPYAVVAHGDSWINNILFKYENGKPKELRFIDFQLSRYCTVAPDLTHFVFSCTDKPFRDLHYQTLLDTYYDSLRTSLAALGSDPEAVFPRAAFQDQMKQFGLTGLGLGVLDIPVVASKPEDAQTIDVMIKDVSGMTQNANKDEVKKRICDVVVDMVDLGYI